MARRGIVFDYNNAEHAYKETVFIVNDEISYASDRTRMWTDFHGDVMRMGPAMLQLRFDYAGRQAQVAMGKYSGRQPVHTLVQTLRLALFICIAFLWFS